MSGPKSLRDKAPLPLPQSVALVLQGGGALGSFQAGVIEELALLSIEVDWVAGISIGAVNAAIIAGNPREQWLEKLADEDLRFIAEYHRICMEWQKAGCP